jgi:hypothetical protein
MTSLLFESVGSTAVRRTASSSRLLHEGEPADTTVGQNFPRFFLADADPVVVLFAATLLGPPSPAGPHDTAVV